MQNSLNLLPIDSHYEIRAVQSDDKTTKNRVIEYLRPHETEALFLLPNLKNPHLPSHYYIAEAGEKIMGVAAHFPPFKSFSLFSEDQAISKKFVHILAKRHTIKSFYGMPPCGKAAFEEFLNLGFRAAKGPRGIFMEASCADVHFVAPREGTIRLAGKKDTDAIVRLQRSLYKRSPLEPIGEEERDRVRFTPVTFCLEIDNQIVCSASSNGLGHKVFQILFVATHPEYQKRGFAKAICSHLIRHFQEKGGEKAALFTDYDNIFAQACYHALGFQHTCEYYFTKFV